MTGATTSKGARPRLSVCCAGWPTIWTAAACRPSRRWRRPFASGTSTSATSGGPWDGSAAGSNRCRTSSCAAPLSTRKKRRSCDNTASGWPELCFTGGSRGSLRKTMRPRGRCLFQRRRDPAGGGHRPAAGHLCALPGRRPRGPLPRRRDAVLRVHSRRAANGCRVEDHVGQPAAPKGPEWLGRITSPGGLSSPALKAKKP